MKLLGHAIAVVAVAGTLSGCGTAISLADGQQKTKVYGGTRTSALSHGGQLDVPFSLAVDTALLPVTIPWTIANHVKAARADREARRPVPPAPATKDGGAR